MNLDQARRHCRQVIAQHSKSFALAGKLLPTWCRDDAFVLYAWCRRCDDAIDLTDVDNQSQQLELLQHELELIAEGPSTEFEDPILRAFADVFHRTQLPRDYPTELLAGMKMDVHHQPMTSQNTLMLYCYRVAGVVGLMMCHMMGVAHDASLINAAHLGMAMQLTNIARDVVEDWQQGRRYLPLDWIDPAGQVAQDQLIPTGPTIPPEIHPGIMQATERGLSWADGLYASGRRGLPALSPRCRWAIATAGAVYGDIGRSIRRRPTGPLAGRAVVGKPRKVQLMLSRLFAHFPSLLVSGLEKSKPRRFPQTTLTWNDVEATLPQFDRHG